MGITENVRGRKTFHKQRTGQLARKNMDKKKNRRVKKTSRRGPIFVSPDGGHTVYQQMADGRKKLIEEDSHARMINELQQDSDMFGFEAYALRRKYPTLKKAYDNYKTIWHLVNDNDSD
jgi:hypothetical protein